MSKPPYHLIVEAGPDKGLKITIPPGGIRVGRSSNNDVALKDPVMSRFHCRFFFKPDGSLWAEDLGSANQTLLNQKPMRETRLHNGDRLLLGDTILKVIHDCILDVTTRNLFGATSTTSAVEGKTESQRAPQRNRKPIRAALLTLLILLAAMLAMLWLYKGRPSIVKTTEVKPMDSSRPQALTIAYEKIQANSRNIFRYVLELDNDELSIQIADLQNQRQVAGQQRKQVTSDTIQSLTDTIEQSDFFALNESYQGLATGNWDQIDLTVTIGRKNRRVQVLNAPEPEACKTVREAIEEFGQNELGLAALALAPDKLMELARSAALMGRSLYDQREIKHDNLAKAIRALHESEWYLETISPKPDYYNEIAALRQEAERELQANYDDLMFLAERAVRLKDWNEAALKLRLVCEKIPDRSDDRHQDARKKLIDVENHLKKK